MTDRKWERVEAQDVRRGDQIAKAKTHEPSEVIDIGPVGASSRWLHFQGGRIRPRHDAKFWRLVEDAPEPQPEPEEQPSSPALAAHDHPTDSASPHSIAVQGVLHSAGMSLGSELKPEQLERAEELASGAVDIKNRDPRFAYIMRGERSTAMTTTEDGKRVRRNSDTQKGLEAALAVLKSSRKPLTRKEIHEKAVAKGVDLGEKSSGGPKIGGVVNEAKAAGTVVDGYIFTSPERGKYSVEKVKGAKASAKSGAKSSAKKGAAKK